ncbi:hypothetical protein Thiowin_00159 [Thiorhodovibrio winogradskyi]|uniref:Uncharacterized protein n=1 Tax=Thiorhodovibrio winogradskyi TaxID=77007 RepID=A0ABZ0S3S9_9GAMM
MQSRVAKKPPAFCSSLQHKDVSAFLTQPYTELCNVRYTVDLHARLAQGKATIIVVAGMRHSGSTALFNVLRLALKESGINFNSGYSENIDLDNMSKTPVLLIKTHELRDDIKLRADYVFTTVRDLRDTIASAK